MQKKGKQLCPQCNANYIYVEEDTYTQYVCSECGNRMRERMLREPEEQNRLKMMGHILSAALWVKDGIEHIHQPDNVKTGFVITGRRHHNCFYTRSLMKVYRLTPHEDGFITSKNFFVNRVEGKEIAIAHGQYHPAEGIEHRELFSEDLY